MVNADEIYQYVKEHPNCTRPTLYEHFAGGMEGKGRKDISHRISNILHSLKKQGRVIETNIERSKRGNNIINSKLVVAEDKPTQERDTELQIAKSAEKSEFHFEKSLDLKPREKVVLYFLSKFGSPKHLVEIAKDTSLDQTTTLRLLEHLRSLGLVAKNLDRTWHATLTGIEEAKKTIPFQALYSATPEDNFFFHIPMLIDHAGESLSDDILAQRAYGYQGFYEKNGVDERQAKEDFLRKIRTHLESDVLRNSFIQQDRFLWRATGDEDQLFLWRLYSMLHTILFKSSKNRKLGMAVWLYEPLLSLLRKTWEMLHTKTESLTPEERFIVLLMANGVQLETILPKVKAEEFREKLRLLGIPIRTYNQGTDKETTIIETKNDMSLGGK